MEVLRQTFQGLSDVIFYLKPKDQMLQVYLREFLYWVCHFNFHPIVSKIGTKENDIADFLSRNYCDTDAAKFFSKENLPPQNKLSIFETDFLLTADW